MNNGFSFSALSLINTNEGLRHAVLESLFSDAKAHEWQALRFGNADQRGWCFKSNLDEHGSKVWLLLREKTTLETESLLISYINKALTWVNEYGSFELITERLVNRINFQITVNYHDIIIKVANGN